MRDLRDITFRFVQSIIEARKQGRFHNYDDVNFLMESFQEISLKEGYVLDAFKVRDSYYRDGEYYTKLYTCLEGSEDRFNPVLTPIKDTFLKKIGLQKCKKSIFAGV